MKVTWPPELRAAIARRLEMVARASELADVEIARKLGISPQGWGHFTKGDRPFQVPLALLLQKNVLKVTLDWLYLGDETAMMVGVLNRLKESPTPVHQLRPAKTPPTRVVRNRARNR